MSQDEQEEVLDFLGDPTTYGDALVKRIDTHAASVFLVGRRALKVKRAVRFPVLDYSTLAKRQAACAAEIEVNRTFAPTIYRGVVAITREANGSLAIGGKGEPVEWAVEMRRFDETRTLDHLASEIDARLADALTVSVPELLTACTPSRQNEIDELLGDPFIAEMATFTRQLDAMQRTSVLTQIRDMVAHPRRGARLRILYVETPDGPVARKIMPGPVEGDEP